jgi:hypothetical protein
VIALVPGREASTEMNGHNKYIAAVVAIASAATIGVTDTPAVAGPSPTTHVSGAGPVTPTADAPVLPSTVADGRERPHRIDDDVADVLVRLTGGVCTGTPIAGTVYVVTAAHCVLTESGEVTRKTVVRDHIRYSPVAVLVDTDYHERPSAVLDAAVLIMAQVIPGPAAQLGSALPDSGDVTLAGFQPIDSDGSLLRGGTVHEHPLPKGASGTRVVRPYAPAACVASASDLDVSDARVLVPCGLVPGASGGGLYVERNGEQVLVGILSTVTADLSTNGVVPLASLHELLQHPEQYTQGFSSGHVHHEHVRSELS